MTATSHMTLEGDNDNARTHAIKYMVRDLDQPAT
jgi:hypothetical protein